MNTASAWALGLAITGILLMILALVALWWPGFLLAVVGLGVSVAMLPDAVIVRGLEVMERIPCGRPRRSTW